MPLRKRQRSSMVVSSGNRISLSQWLILPILLSSCSHTIFALQTTSHRGLPQSTKFTPRSRSWGYVLPEPLTSSMTILKSRSLEDDFYMINISPDQESTVATAKPTPWFSSLRSAARLDRKELAELGISFMLSYNLISNINGSIFMSLSWYIASIRTGLSPLAPGGWKSLLAAYAGLYVFNTLARPLRLAVALSITKRVSNLLDRTQERLGCSKAFSVGFVFASLITLWLGLAAAGITLASTMSGIPIWHGL